MQARKSLNLQETEHDFDMGFNTAGNYGVCKKCMTEAWWENLYGDGTCENKDSKTLHWGYLIESAKQKEEMAYLAYKIQKFGGLKWTGNK